ncbi:proline-rich p65 protein [Lasius niger]|uniref:Proline-rich p65 protein n=1 Tax=Lasius niger TaxID=67767 RepID=A0A0J7KIE4_LASNI|nr:proline-rich p65 protein [Lasius niger]
MRKAANEKLIIEIPGPNGASLAGILQEKLQIALDDMARINKPAALSELRLAGIDPSITVDEICRDLATIVVSCKGIYLVSYYVSPNISMQVFQEFLDELDRVTMYIGSKFLICGD